MSCVTPQISDQLARRCMLMHSAQAPVMSIALRSWHPAAALPSAHPTPRASAMISGPAMKKSESMPMAARRP